MTQCTAIKPGGERCKGVPIDDSGLCYSHHPDTKAERQANGRRGGKRGGRGRPSVELKRLAKRLEDLADRVLSGEVDRSLAYTAGQLLNFARGCVKDSLDARDKEEFEERLEELERQLEKQKSNRRGFGT